MGVTVDFVARGVLQRAFESVPGEGFEAGVVVEAEFTNVHHLPVGGELGGVRGEVPRFHLVVAHLDAPEVAYARDLGLVLRHAAGRAQFFDFVFSRVGHVCCTGGVDGFGSRGEFLHVDEVEVLVVWLRGTVYFVSDDRDAVAVVAVLLAACPRRAWRFAGYIR